MKRYITGILLVFSMVLYPVKYRHEPLEHVAQLYQEHKYDQAWDSLLTMGPNTPAQIYNLGNIAYKKSDYDMAQALWYAAYLRGSRDVRNASRFNSDFVTKKSPMHSSHFGQSTLDRICDVIPLFFLQVLFLFFWLMFLFFIKKYKHGTKYTVLLILFGLIVTSGVAIGLKYRSNNQRIGIIMKSDVSLFAGPDGQYHVLDHLDRAYHVTVHEQRVAWYKVSTEKKSGWVMQDSIVVV